MYKKDDTNLKTGKIIVNQFCCTFKKLNQVMKVRSVVGILLIFKVLSIYILHRGVF